MILAMFLIACGDAVGKFLTQSYPLIQVLWVRSWVFLLFALCIVWPRGILPSLRSGQLRLQLLRSTLLVIETLLFIWSFRLLPLAEVNAIGAATPLIVLALAVPLLGERVGWHRWSAVLAGFIGVLFIVKPGIAVFGWAMLLPLLGVILWGFYQITSRLVSRWDSAETSLLYAALLAFIVFSIAAPWWWQMPDGRSWFLLLTFGVINSFAHYALIKALAIADASALQPFSYTLLLWSVLLGWWVFADWPDFWTIFGALCIVISGIYALHREYLKSV